MTGRARAKVRLLPVLLLVSASLPSLVHAQSPTARESFVDALEMHGFYILAAAILVAAQAGLIAALLASRARRRESEARSNAILRAIPDLMFVQTRDGVYLDYAAKDPSILLVSPSQFIGKNMREILPPEIAQSFLAALERLFAGEEPVLVEYDVAIPGREVRYFEARLVRHESDKFLSIVRDITDRKQAMQALDRAHTELLRVSRMATLGEFAGSIAHELAQPLTAIIANSHACLRMLERPVVDWDEVREGLEDVLQAGKLAREVIHSTRHLFSKEELERVPVQLSDIVNEVCVMVHSSIRAKHITLDLRFEPELPIVRADRVQLRQVILNLVSNSIQAMEHLDAGRARRLGIAVELDENGAVKLVVNDTGIGLANVDRARLFSASYTTKPDGMGWGLSISRSIIEAHGGRMWAEPTENVGAVFCFTLPAASTAGAPAFESRRDLERERPQLM